MRVDQHRQHAQRAVVLDEAHAAHVGCEVVHDGGVARRCLAGVLSLKIELQVLDLREALVPLVERLDIDGANLPMSLPEQVGNQMAADKSAAAAHDDQIARIDFHIVFLTSLKGTCARVLLPDAIR